MAENRYNLNLIGKNVGDIIVILLLDKIWREISGKMYRSGPRSLSKV